MFFTPVKNFWLSRKAASPTAFKQGEVYLNIVLEEYDFGSITNTLEGKIRYLSSNWIKVVEPSDIYELVKLVLLTKTGEE